MAHESVTVPFDEMLEAVADHHRRTLLVALLEENPQDELSVLGDDDALEYLTRMRHVHLPKLDEYGFINWDQEANEVTKGPNFAEIKPLLELLRDHGDELPEDWL
jgi:hypothetical protein